MLQIPGVLLEWFDKRTDVLVYYVDVHVTLVQNSHWLCTVGPHVPVNTFYCVVTIKFVYPFRLRERTISKYFSTSADVTGRLMFWLEFFSLKGPD